jgi:predicted amidohydrolase YtcJ
MRLPTLWPRAPLTLFTNARGYSLALEGAGFGAMLVREGLIERLFDDPTPHVAHARVVDLGGRVVLPGFIDSHFHFLATVGLSVLGARVSYLEGATLAPASLAAVRARLQALAARKPPRQPLLFYHYIVPAVCEGRLPSRRELDAWLPGRVVTVLAMDGHSSAHSTAALAHIGLEAPADGVLTGTAHEFHTGKINAFFQSQLSLGMLLRGLVATAHDALAHGLTGIRCLEGFDDDPNDKSLWLMTRIAAALPLKLRTVAQYLDPARAERHAHSFTGRRLGGCGAWEMDGAVSSHTAAFFEGYADRPEERGACYYEAERVQALIARAVAAGYEVSAHAIGTAGIERVLTAFERTARDRPPERAGGDLARHAIEHFEFPTRDQVRRALREGLMLSVQPGFAWFDGRYQRSYERFLAPEVLARQVPLRTLAAAGALLLGSSDSPVQHLNPFVQLQGMVTFPLVGESLSVFEALRSYTYNGAYAVHEEGQRGTLQPGKAADFVVLDRDPFQVPRDEIHTLRVCETWVDGVQHHPGPKPNPWALLLKGLLGARQKV